MNAVALLVTAAVLGVDYGWQPTADGQLEYIIQIEPVTLIALRGGQDLVSQMDPYVRHVRRFRVRVGTEIVPRRGTPPGEPQQAGSTSPPPGIAYGWQPLDTQQMELIVQIAPERLAAMRNGEEVSGEIPSTVQNVAQVRLRAGTGPLPQQGLQIAAATLPAELTEASHALQVAAEITATGPTPFSGQPPGQPAAPPPGQAVGQPLGQAIRQPPGQAVTQPPSPPITAASELGPPEVSPPRRTEQGPATGQTGREGLPETYRSATAFAATPAPQSTPSIYGWPAGQAASAPVTPDVPGIYAQGQPALPGRPAAAQPTTDADGGRWSSVGATVTGPNSSTHSVPQPARSQVGQGAGGWPSPPAASSASPSAWGGGPVYAAASTADASAGPASGSAIPAAAWPAPQPGSSERTPPSEPVPPTAPGPYASAWPAVPPPASPAWQGGYGQPSDPRPGGAPSMPADSLPYLGRSPLPGMTGSPPMLPWEERLAGIERDRRAADLAQDFWADLAQTARDPSLAFLHEDAQAASGDRPWGPLTLALVVLFASLGANLYMGWIASDMYRRYLELADELVEDEGSARARLDEDLLDDDDHEPASARRRRQRAALAA